MRRARIVLVASVSALALAATGCGGDDSSSSEATAADEWAEGLCTAVTDLRTSLQEVVDEVTNVSSFSSDTIDEARDDVRAATETFRDDVGDLGTPDTESGEEAKQAVDDFSSTLESESQDIESTIDGISGLSDLPSAAQDASASLASVYAALSTMLASIRTGDAQDELETAFENAEACDDID